MEEGDLKKILSTIQCPDVNELDFSGPSRFTSDNEAISNIYISNLSWKYLKNGSIVLRLKDLNYI